ncbi:MAG: tRNA uridine-5-carboxymethylaminomethyl(34) synthesis GTPase MnmE [Chitinophagales bacterium]|nr:tRNA uridine-5-carboxymethylaminomethyl(34) synthesis GTPase MnmE [Chitinophagales bacterium]MDW8273499.1 tRNA uridine-5-carboxymethylaminomethyl(34) synthesis GTPase MnmE [Chitinophagales bacterium]
MNFTDTIVAPATPEGTSALAIVRLSGPEAIKIASKVFKGKNLEHVPTHTVHYGFIVEPGSHEIIDEVMVTIFRAPKSYTSEDIVEITCHGSVYIVRKITEKLIEAGARLANPGEFSLRAFMNGRINLAQAEAVADLISSQNEWQHKTAIYQMRSGWSKELLELRKELIDYTALIELELDFAEEDVEFAKRERLLSFINNLIHHLSRLTESFVEGNAIKEGFGVAIIGKPNAGKSTLLNALLNEERAIVSEVPGTTRDFIEDTLQYKGLLFRLTDTAGIRATADLIEGIGVEKALEKASKARIVLYLFDINESTPFSLLHDIEVLNIDDTLIIPVANKIDQASWKKTAPFAQIPNIQYVSAKNRFRIEELKEFIYQICMSKFCHAFEGATITNLRHFEALTKATKALRDAKEHLENKLSGEIVAFHLREALDCIGQVTGQVHTEELLSSIFSRFCIGK